MTTEAIEDYLKIIYDLQKQGMEVSTTALSDKLGVAPASITGMVKKLASLKLVNYKPYQGVTLTIEGERIALQTIRHHRLVESYLSETLDLSWDEVHREAEKWEHVLSDEMEQRIDERLGYPKADPHGSPIPAKDGTLPEIDRIPLSALNDGDSGTIVEVCDDDPELLRRLQRIGMLLGVEIAVVSNPPAGRTITIQLEGSPHTFDFQESDCIYIKLASKSDQ